MSETTSPEVRRLDGADLRAHLDAVAAVLADCVTGGASVGLLAPFTAAAPLQGGPFVTLPSTATTKDREPRARRPMGE